MWVLCAHKAAFDIYIPFNLILMISILQAEEKHNHEVSNSSIDSNSNLNRG